MSLVPSELEPELEELLLRLVPDMASNWQRARGEDIAAMETIADGDLPRCYRWLLLRLGGGLGEIGYRNLDFSVRRIVEGYARDEFVRKPGILCIAHDSDPEFPRDRYYDLARPLRDDALVVMAEPPCDEFEANFETLRELIASCAFNNYRYRAMPERCRGLLVTDRDDAVGQLVPVLEGLGFRAPVPIGSLCLLYDDGTIAFSSQKNPDWLAPHAIPFKVGGPSVSILRKFLGEVVSSTELIAKDLDWNPF